MRTSALLRDYQTRRADRRSGLEMADVVEFGWAEVFGPLGHFGGQ
jgi:hypothetical protein